jgi:hypothetical protein
MRNYDNHKRKWEPSNNENTVCGPVIPPDGTFYWPVGRIHEYMTLAYLEKSKNQQKLKNRMVDFAVFRYRF